MGQKRAPGAISSTLPLLSLCLHFPKSNLLLACTYPTFPLNYLLFPSDMTVDNTPLYGTVCIDPHLPTFRGGLNKQFCSFGQFT